MQTFLLAHRATVEAVANSHGVTDPHEIKRCQTVCAFLVDNPELLSWRGRDKPDPSTAAGIALLVSRFLVCRAKKDWPAEPTTVPDEAVSLVMQVVYGYTEKQTQQIKREHQHAMSAENIVGALLERYIASVFEPQGWVWCAGDFVKAVDFIKYQAADGGWQSVQVKNRDNTENSSSSAIRNGTAIEKWFRTYARTGADNWHNFPEPEFRKLLSESGFRAFVVGYLKS